jgi:hypothetical protein
MNRRDDSMRRVLYSIYLKGGVGRQKLIERPNERDWEGIRGEGGKEINVRKYF